MKSIIFSIALISLVAVGCNPKAEIVNTNTDSTLQAQTNMAQSSSSNESLLDCTAKNHPPTQMLEVDDIRLTVVKPWSVTYQTDDAGCILVAQSPYMVYLKVQVFKNSAIAKVDGFDFKNIKAGEIFKIPCGGAIACYGAHIENDWYDISFQIDSTQPVPSDHDGVWTPDYNISDADITRLMSTMEKVQN